MQRIKSVFLIASIIGVLLCGCGLRYKKEIEWAIYDQTLMVAVEVDGYDGDSVKAGIYTAEVGHIVSDRTPQVFDVYIFDRKPQNKRDLIGRDPNYTVGGYNAHPVEISVNKGEYVVIQPCDVYNPTGIFEMKLKK